MPLKNRKQEIACLLMLNIAVTFLFRSILIGRYEAVQAMAEGKTPVTIVMYHSLLKDSRRAGTYVISPAQFESDMRYLIDNGYHFVTMDDLINFVYKRGAKLPDKPVMITLDDGYYNNYMYAYPIMKELRGRFVLSIIGKQTEEYSELHDRGEEMSGYYSHVTWEQIEEMEESGVVDIQNHSYNLHTHTKSRNGSGKKHNESVEEYREFLTEDVMKLQKLLQRKADVQPNTFTYPFGRISPESVDILKGMGFKATLTCHEGINYIGKGDRELLFKLKRYNRPFGKTSEQFFRGKLE